MLSRTLALLALVVLAACDTAEAPLAPTDDPVAAAPEEAVSPALVTGQRIVFTSYRNGPGDIYRMTPQGTGVTRLTFATVNERSPAWSPDNQRIAFVRERPTQSNQHHTDIYIMNADGTNGHWALPSPSPWPLISPSWSPDGSRLALTLQGTTGWYIGSLHLATGQFALFGQATGGRRGWQPSYDPTGKKIVYVGEVAQTVEQINIDGTGHRVLVSSTKTLRDPRFSPDGKKIAYAKTLGTEEDENPEIFVKNLTDGTNKRVTTSAGDDFQPAWSPDGLKLAFVSWRSGRYQIWTMNASTGGSLLRISSGSADEWEPRWTY